MSWYLFCTMRSSAYARVNIIQVTKITSRDPCLGGLCLVHQHEALLCTQPLRLVEKDRHFY